MENIYKYIINNVTSNKMDKQVAARMMRMLKNEDVRKNDDIAIIGIGSKLPFADDIYEFWENIKNGVTCKSRFPDKRSKDIDEYIVSSGVEESENIKYYDGSFLDSIDGFDYKLFKISPKEASVMDPYQRLFLQTVWQTVEDAGYGGKKLAGSKTGVFVGYASNAHDSYHKMVYNTDPSLMSIAAVGNITAIIPTRIAYLLDLRGPTMVLDTACSSSLIAINQACCSIRNGDCDMAIAGGIKIHLIPIDKEYTRVGFESSDGFTRTFDDNSDGTGKGEGVVTLLLKPLSLAKRDKDNIYAVIKGSAVNQDGSSMGITAPNPDAQVDVIVKAWENAGIDPTTISYIEAHGTATKLGDPIEISSLNRAFRKYTDRSQFCPIGSVKPTMGHMYECSGMGGLLNIIMALRHHEIPPTLLFNKPNKAINFCDSPVYVNTKLRKWITGDDHPMRCGINSFGVSGTNCHMILEEALDVEEERVIKGKQVLALSAKSVEALRNLVKDYKKFLQRSNDIELGDICYTANTGRGHYNHRLVLIISSIDQLKESIDELCQNELFENDNERYYYQEHKIIPSNKELRDSGEITEAEKHELNKKAKEKIKEFNSSNCEDVKLLAEICTLYIQGADIDWEELYKQKDRKKVSLPVYPFENERCWVGNLKQANEVIGENYESFYYSMKWKAENLQFNDDKVIEGPVIVIRDGRIEVNELGDKIISLVQKEGKEVIEVKIGDDFEQSEENIYTVENSTHGYIKLFQAVREKKPVQLIHLLSLENNGHITSLEELKESQNKACYSLYYIVNAFVKCGIKDKLDVVIISEAVNQVTGEENILKPENASLFGYGKAINKELPEFQCRCIDIDENTTIDNISNELKYIGNDYITAYRDGKRYIELFSKIDTDKIMEKPLKVRDQGVYVITGGTGGIGLEVAKYLSSQNKVNLALLNRSEFPSNEKWDEILARDEDKRIIKKIEILREIEKNGSQVKFCSVDVSNKKDLERVINSLRKDYGKINGVVHGAGVALDCSIFEKDEQAFTEVISPKIYGTWLLDKLTQTDELDFFVMFSSVASIFTMFGQGDYVAANSYMDSYCNYRSKLGRKTLTINWTSWKETGMASENGFAIDTIFKTLSTSRGIRGFNKLLEMGVTRGLVGEINYGGIGNSLLEHSKVKLSDDISKKISIHKKQMKKKNNNTLTKDQIDLGSVKLEGRKNGKYTETEMELAGIFRNVLGFDEIDVYDNFFEMGADSIMLMKIQPEIEKKYEIKIEVVDMFEYTTISKLAEYIVDKSEGINVKDDKSIIEKKENHGDIAIIGMSLKFPMADTADEYWRNIKNGLDCVTLLPDTRQGDINRYIRFKNIPINAIEYDNGAFLDRIDEFDYSYFNMPPKEGSLTDPNHRLFLETALGAIEDAGYGGKKMVGTNTGVYLGFASTQMYFLLLINDVVPSLQSASLVGNTAAVSTGRVSYQLDLQGPSMVIDSACSSSLVAIHTACKAIKAGECDQAIAGGVRVSILPAHKKGEARGIGMDSSDGRARSFDDLSDGTGSGEGVAAILLKPLKNAIKDGDNIYALIKGSSSNQDGISAGITAPNPAAQERVIIRAWQDAGIDPETISYIEAHGTGTQLGDPIEIKGIQNAFERFTDKKQFCAVGSVKTNIAHLSEAAGIAGLIKAVLALKNKEIPPSLFFNTPNSKIAFSDSPVYVNTVPRKWETNGHPRRCGVSAFGMSGTNCHIVLEEYVKPEGYVVDSLSDETVNVLTISAKSLESLNKLIKNYKSVINEERYYRLKDICYTANTGRGHYGYRLAIITKGIEDLKQKLEKIEATGVESFNDCWYFYGKHKIISDDRQNKEVGDITEKRKKEYGRQVVTKLEKFISLKCIDDVILGEVCNLYVKGADVEWTELYKAKDCHIVSLPTYAFESKRCWLDIPEYDENIELELTPSGCYFRNHWIKEKLPIISQTEEYGTVLIFKGNYEINEKLISRFKNKDKEVIEVEFGETYIKRDENSYVVGNTQEDYNKLFDDIKYKHPTKIIHLLTMGRDDEAETLVELEGKLSKGVYSLFYITKAMVAADINENIDMVLVSRDVVEVTGEEEQLRPWNMPLFGLGKVIKLENSNIMCRCIDIDECTSENILMNEIEANTGTYQVSYRNGQRYIEEIEECDVENVADSKVEVREDGVYVITGGTGGMGIEISKYLASKKKVNIVLIGRSKIPDRIEWDDVVKTNSRRDKKIIQKINAIREIEALGANVLYYNSDVFDEETMKNIFTELKNKFKTINGIVHSAGIAGEGFLFDKEETTFKNVLYPKVHGTWIIDSITKDFDLDFFVMCSSVATIFPGKGQSDYASANSYLDAYAAYRNRQGNKTVTFNWVAWKDTGMAVDYGVNVDSSFKALTTKKAINSFDKVLNKNISRILVGECNYKSDDIVSLDIGTVRLSPMMRNAIDKTKEKIENYYKTKYKNLKVVGSDNNDYKELEEKLGQAYSEVLGLTEINIHDNFYELGGDSVMINRLHSIIELQYPGKIKLMDLFEYTSIYKLSRYIIGETEEEDLRETEDEIEEETRKLLNDLESGASSVDDVINSLFED